MVSFFFDRNERIPVLEDWEPNIVQGKGYDINTKVGYWRYQQQKERLASIKTSETQLKLKPYKI